MNANVTILIGRLTRDPELRFLPSGTPVCEVGLAVNESYKDKDGNKKEKTFFGEIELWSKKGEVFAEYGRKGRLVYINGRLKLDQWEKDGQKYSRTKIVCNQFEFLDRKPSDQGSSSSKETPKPSTISSDKGENDYTPKKSFVSSTLKDAVGEDEIPF